MLHDTVKDEVTWSLSSRLHGQSGVDKAGVRFFCSVQEKIEKVDGGSLSTVYLLRLFNKRNNPLTALPPLPPSKDHIRLSATFLPPSTNPTFSFLSALFQARPT